MQDLEKMRSFLKGCMIIAESTGDKESLYMANDALSLNKLIKKKEIWHNRKMAISYNLNCRMNGF